ncbi:hypothetical protein ABZ749_29190 [Micromonospora sp. NPDC047753]
MSFTLFADARLALARDSLAGLSTGDALWNIVDHLRAGARRPK